MRTGPCFDIAHLFVEEAQRGQGLGRALIDAAKGFADGQGVVRLTIGTSPDNPSAAGTYRAMALDEIASSLARVSASRFSQTVRWV
ncbi:acetyltransferase (GNAT) family protein [Yoonia sediminilitoris]|uniref:Acetyltransferase (GNAT) family protein n=1 Tax=Yoonia sediminilitoris TaxID=1286148 RepID=A0A2T6KB35_9RHOB|nr:GNAT family N-acetyltransferase [Yoonia sediminilitoris]PUB12082.1 acetyltransferase (GNAT) family protein [Yoonia sediminilitoris]RCW92909.1 acetyltransferase (GNAT) family protein [Yoonia sediminilitoris]